MKTKITAAGLLFIALSGLIIAAQDNLPSDKQLMTKEDTAESVTQKAAVETTIKTTTQAKTTIKTTTQAAPQTAARASGRQAYIDPKTGELTSEIPTELLHRQQVTSSAQVTSEAEPELEVIDHPNGMQEVRLNGHMNSHFEVELDCTGNLKDSHSGDEHANAPECDQ